MSDNFIKPLSKKAKDYTGFKIGKLKIKSFIGRKKYKSTSTPNWLSVCDCGNEFEIDSIHISNAISQNYSPSCGCAESKFLKDYANQKIGKLKVIKLIGRKQYKSSNTPLWLCVCDCGTETEVTSLSLRSAKKNNHNLSCGCEKIKRANKYSGKVIGHLTVIEKDSSNPSKYKCRCSCGNITFQETYMLTRAIKTSSAISCGCKYYVEIKAGDQFHYWTSVGEGSSKIFSGKKRKLWKCKCKCGTEREVLKEALTSGHSKSCGCLHIEKISQRKPAFSYLIKNCPSCSNELPKEKFGKDKNRPGGLKSLCRKCNYSNKDLADSIVRTALRKKQIKRATPSWVNIDELKKIHSARIDLQEKLDTLLHVDHIVPIIHEDVCGLNVPENLQITTAKFNTSKGNRFDIKKYKKYLEESIINNGIRIHESVLKLLNDKFV